MPSIFIPAVIFLLCTAYLVFRWRTADEATKVALKEFGAIALVTVTFVVAIVSFVAIVNGLNTVPR